MKDYYNRIWKQETPFGKWTGENFQYHLKFFKPYLGKNVLEIGCGQGDFLNRITDKGWGMDISNVAIDRARKLYPRHIFTTTTKEFNNVSFDTVCLIDVLEHIPDVLEILSEIKRLLKHSGHLLIATNQMTRIKSLGISLLCFDSYFHPTSPHLRYFTKDTLKDVLHMAGFEVVKYQKNRTYFGFIPQGQLVVAKLKGV